MKTRFQFGLALALSVVMLASATSAFATPAKRHTSAKSKHTVVANKTTAPKRSTKKAPVKKRKSHVGDKWSEEYHVWFSEVPTHKEPAIARVPPYGSGSKPKGNGG